MIENEGEEVNEIEQKLGEAKSYIQGKFNELCQSVQNMGLGGKRDVHFILSMYGVQIVTKDRVLIQQGTIWSTGYKSIVLSNKPVYQQGQDHFFEQTNWSMVQFNERRPEHFWIENIYGEYRPKLMPSYKDPLTWSNLLSSNRLKDGYKDQAKCLWQIEDKSDPSLKKSSEETSGMGQKLS